MSQMDHIFEALAHPIRRDILNILKKEGELSSGDLSARFDLAKPSLSHHFKTLLYAGLIDRERRGRQIFYRIQMSVLEEAAQLAFQLFGSDGGDMTDEAKTAERRAQKTGASKNTLMKSE